MSSTALGMGAWGAYDSATLSRTRTRASSFLGGQPRFGSGLGSPLVQQTVVVDGALNGMPASDDVKTTRRRETIFGPDVGDDDQPGWANPDEGNEVSVDTVKRWVEKAKSEEGLHATTTLQALVNLKRPTLLLQPLDANAHGAEVMASSGTSSSPRSSMLPASPLHLLKFNYDAMTPQVQVTLTLHPTPEPSDVNVTKPQPKVLYSGMHPGGFNQTFSLPASSAIDFSSAIAPLPSPETEDKREDKQDPKEDGSNVRAQSEDTTRSSYDRSNAAPATSTELAAIPELSSGVVHPQEEPRRRFGLFGRRQRQSDIESQIEMTPTAGAPDSQPQASVEPKPEEKPEPEHGMRLIIRIEGVGAEGSLRRRNAQLTHILVSGTWAPEAGSNAVSLPNAHGKRVWVVKVVRREAQIGGHSFLLKEIYGLSSSSNSNDTAQATANDPFASTPNECIVCLTSPRDVVLLPCRHLVVCRECAVGMVEFGAGGRVARRDDEPADGGATAAATSDAAGAAAPPAAPAPAPLPTRRKKKAKGWYCPVCRQPYTSLLRLALAPSKPGVPSRAPSLRSVRTTRSLAPTLPDGAEAMLDRLAPEPADGDDDDDRWHEHDHDHDQTHSSRSSFDRPQFVVAEQTIHPPPAAAIAHSLPAQRTLETAPANTPTSIVGTAERKPEASV